MAKITFSKILLYILFLSFVLGEVARVQFTGAVAVKALDLSVFIFVLYHGIFLRNKSKNLELTKPIILFLSVAMFSLAVNFINFSPEELLASFLYILRWIGYAALYFVISGLDKNSKKKIRGLLLASGGAILLLGFMQYFFYPDLRNLYYLGWDEHLYRLFSTFLDPNFTGIFLSLYFLFVLDLFIKKKSNALSLLLTSIPLGIVLTFSRSAYLTLFVGLFTYLLFMGKKKIIFIFLFLFTLAALLMSMFGLKSEGTNLLRTTSSEARVESAKEAIFIFQDNPVFGVGFNAYRYVEERYTSSLSNDYPDHASSGTDNSFLFVLATTGLVGFIIYIYLWFKILSVSKFKKSALLLSSSIALLFSAIFVNSLFYTFLMFWIWMLLGVAED